MCPISDIPCQQGRMHCLLVVLGCGWDWLGFYIGVSLMKHRCLDHCVQSCSSLVMSIPSWHFLLPHLSPSHTWCGGFHKLCIIWFKKFVFKNFVKLIIFFCSRWFLLVKLLFSLKWHLSKLKIFRPTYTANWCGREIILFYWIFH
jgi:hypothetical protein